MTRAEPEQIVNRRPLTSRSAVWARFLTDVLIRAGVSPNAISVVSVVFAVVGAALLIHWPNAVGLLATAVCVQLRLLCNLLDGMVAIDGKRQSPTGALYNEVPDRLADSLFIVAMGVLGGLTLSAMKRSLGAKDWGVMIEGHGGMLDRMDSVSFAAPVFFHVVRFFFT